MFDELGQVFDMMLIGISLAHLAVNTFHTFDHSTVGFFSLIRRLFYVICVHTLEAFAGFRHSHCERILAAFLSYLFNFCMFFLIIFFVSIYDSD